MFRLMNILSQLKGKTMPFKFNIGDVVHCYREDDFDFVGRVIMRAQLSDDTPNEYEVTNAPVSFTLFPVLIWETEMEKV